MLNYEIIAANETTPERVKATDKNGTEFWIPTDPANSDYQAYLASLEKPTAKK